MKLQTITTTTAALMASSVMMAHSASAATIIGQIDDFETGPQTVTRNTVGTNNDSPGTPFSSPLLGTVNRVLSATKTLPNTGTSTVGNSIEDGSFNFTTSTGTTRGSVGVNYGTFSPKDFTLGGKATLLGFIIDSASTNVPLVFSFTDSLSRTGTLTYTTLGTESDILKSVAFSSISNPLVDFTSITAFSFTAATPSNTNGFVTLSILGVATVPEPGTVLGLLAVGGVTLASRLKKKS